MAAIVSPAAAWASAVAIAVAMAVRLASGAVRMALWPVTEAVAAAERLERRARAAGGDLAGRAALAVVDAMVASPYGAGRRPRAGEPARRARRRACDERAAGRRHRARHGRPRGRRAGRRAAAARRRGRPPRARAHRRPGHREPLARPRGPRSRRSRVAGDHRPKPMRTMSAGCHPVRCRRPAITDTRATRPQHARSAADRKAPHTFAPTDAFAVLCRPYEAVESR